MTPLRIDPTLPPCPLCGAGCAAETLYDCECYFLPAFQPAYLLQQAGIKKTAALQQARDHYTHSLPPRYRSYLREALPDEVMDLNPAAIEAANAAKLGSFLYLHGPSGAAKSHLAVRTAAQLVTGGLTTTFSSEVRYFESLTSAFDDPSAKLDLQSPQMVVLDDFGRRRPSPFVVEQLYSLLEHRWSHELALIVTSNLSPERAVAALTSDPGLAEGIISRLCSGSVEEMKRAGDHRKSTAL